MTAVWNNDYTIYKHRPGYGALTFSEVFQDEYEFEAKVLSIGSDDENLHELYRILAQKYAWATTRYMMEEAFILSIRRELEITWPVYLKQKAIMDQLYTLNIEEIQRQMTRTVAGSRENEATGTSVAESEDSDTSLNNVVNANNAPVVNADTVAIKNKSNTQTSNVGSSTSSGSQTNTNEGRENYNDEVIELGNKLEAINNQYEATSRDYLQQIYKKMDPLFRVIL